MKNKNGNVIKPAGTAMRLKTGLTTSWANIYDMGGKVAEFTTEINPLITRSIFLRGDYCYVGSFFAPSGDRWFTQSNAIRAGFGFRSTLFLK